MNESTTLTDTHDKLYQAALGYVKDGFSVLPTKDDKLPAIKWKHLQEILPSEADLSAFNDPICKGVGVVCGKVSGNLEVIDIDTKNDLTGNLLESIQRAIVSQDALLYRRLRIITTPSGGAHIYYRCESVEGNQKLAVRPPTADEEARGVKNQVLIETRGQGGFVVAPPTDRYSYLQERDTPQITTDERDTLLSICRSFNQVFKADTANTLHHFTGDSPYLTTPWEDFNQRGDIKDLLLPLGWKVDGESLERIYFTRPGKDKGVSADYLKSNRLFKVWSSSTEFEVDRAMSLTTVLTKTKFNNDYKESAKYLEQAGYGQRKVQQVASGGINSQPKPDSTTLDDILTSIEIDITDEIIEPPVYVEFATKDGFTPICTLQNFSAIIGKAKSKKTFFVNLILSTVLGSEDNSVIRCRHDVGEILLFDTEQSSPDVQRNVTRILNGRQKPAFFRIFPLRKFNPTKRIELIKHRVYQAPVGSIVVIDGVRDLAFDINSPEEATNITTDLMKWTEEKNIHIIVVIHQNKADNNARGHLGTEVVNKAESVISVEKDKDNPDVSIIKPEYCRNREFEAFSFRVTPGGIPEVTDGEALVKQSGNKNPRTKVDAHNIPDSQHQKILDEVFAVDPSYKYKDILIQIKLCVKEYAITIGENKAGEFLGYYQKRGWVTKTEGHRFTMYSRVL